MKKKCFRKFLLTSLLSIAGVFVASSVVSNAQAENNLLAEEARADSNWVQNIDCFFVPCDDYASKCKSYKFVCYDNTTWKCDIQVNSSNALTKTYFGRQIFECSVTDGSYISHLIICGYSDENCGGTEIFYSGNLEVPTGFSTGWYGTIVMDSDFSGDNGWGLSEQVQWARTENEVILKTSECSTPSASTTRVFFYNSGTHWASNGHSLIRAWGGSADVELWSRTATVATTYNLTWFQDDDDTWYGYADIPSDISGFQFAEFDAADSRSATVVADDYYSNNLWFGDDGGAQNAVLYASSEGNNITIGSAHDSVCGASLIEKVLNACDTCSNNSYSGYNSYYRINQYFYSFATDDAKAALVTTLNGVSPKDVSTIMTAIKARSDAGTNKVNYLWNNNFKLIGFNEVDTTNIIIITASSFVLIAIVGLSILTIKKSKGRKQD